MWIKQTRPLSSNEALPSSQFRAQTRARSREAGPTSDSRLHRAAPDPNDVGCIPLLHGGRAHYGSSMKLSPKTTVGQSVPSFDRRCFLNHIRTGYCGDRKEKSGAYCDSGADTRAPTNRSSFRFRLERSRDIQFADKTIRTIIEISLSIQLISQTSADDARPEALMGGGLDRWPAYLAPPQLEPQSLR